MVVELSQSLLAAMDLGYSGRAIPTDHMATGATLGLAALPGPVMGRRPAHGLLLALRGRYGTQGFRETASCHDLQCKIRQARRPSHCAGDQGYTAGFTFLTRLPRGVAPGAPREFSFLDYPGIRSICHCQPPISLGNGGRLAG